MGSGLAANMDSSKGVYKHEKITTNLLICGFLFDRLP